MRISVPSLAVISIFFAAACGPVVDLSTSLQVEAVSSGWFDAGIVAGTNKLVPSASFRLKNASGQKLTMLQVNALFRRVGDQDEWGSAFVTAAGSGGLLPGAASAITVKSPIGYTGVESGAEMLGNPNFIDARVDLFARYGSTQWTRLGGYPITRRLVAR